MPMNDAYLNVMAAAGKAAATHVAIHTAVPDLNTGTNQSTAPRKPAAWGTVAQGDFSNAGIQFTGGTPNGPATHVGFWSALTGGTFYGYAVLTGDQTFNSAGEFTLDAASINGS
jgi:hypothetical protein